MREKSANSIGNTYAFVVNERLYDQLGRLLKDDLRFNANANGDTTGPTVVAKLR
jgi:hypothetical protein